MMNGKGRFLSLILLCSAIFISCHKVSSIPEIVETYEPTSTLTVDYMQTKPILTPTVDSTQTEWQTPVPSVEISEVTFSLSDLKSYLTFDKDGLTMPYIEMLYQKERIEYDNRDYQFASPEYYLSVAEYDMNGDGKIDYIVKRPDPNRSGGARYDEAFFDVIYAQADGTLKKMDGHSNGLLTSEYPIAILNTTTNGFYDISVTTEGCIKSVHEFNGISYNGRDLGYDKRVGYDRYLSSADINFKLENNTIKLRYNLRLFTDDNNKDYHFFVVGLFSTAKKEGIVENDRLWACDEDGKPKLFSTKENFSWVDAVFYSEYAGADLSLYDDDLIWPDEVKIIMYEP